LKKIIDRKIRPLIQRFGIDIVRVRDYPVDFSEQNIEIYESVKPYTMTSPDRMNALIDAVHYVVKNKIDGAMVECGVWKGGSTMAIALTLKRLGAENRDLYLYDTFSGMSAPSDADVSFINGAKAHEYFSKTRTSEDTSDWCISSLDEVKENMLNTGYQKERIHFIKGKVEDTIPNNIPNEIALLRLDTDWYESTKHELTHLFPLLKPNGVLIIDDYGHWEGARKAVDEYISDKKIRILLNRIDYAGRIAIKT
jgi:predicted O-methyltransferase YrrM